MTVTYVIEAVFGSAVLSLVAYALFTAFRDGSDPQPHASTFEQRHAARVAASARLRRAADQTGRWLRTVPPDWTGTPTPLLDTHPDLDQRQERTP